MDFLAPDVPLWEIILRSVVVFLTLLVILRFSGKRDVGEMSPSDLILLLLLSANVHTSLSGSDKSLLGGIVGAIALITTNHVLNRFAYKNKKFEKTLKGHPEIIINKGIPCEEIMKRHLLTETQLKTAIRKEGVTDYADVRLAVLETDGNISVIKNS